MDIGKQEITWSDLESCPVWHFDPDTELFRPLKSLNDPIGSIDELHFRAVFTAPSGQEFSGSIAGDTGTAIGIFRNGRWYAVNKNWRQTSLDQLSRLVEDSSDLSISDAKQLLPLRYETRIEREPFIEQAGLFDLA